MAPRGRPRVFDREQALDAAMDLFWRRGFSATSVADLCAAMGINPPSLYAAFGSKEALYEAALMRYAERAGPVIWGGMADQPTAYGAVQSMLLASASSLPAPGTPLGCMVALSSVGEEGAERLSALARTARAEGLELLTARLRRAVAAGEIDPGADIGAIARFYVCVQQGMSIQARDGATQNDLAAIARAALAAWPALTRLAAAHPAPSAPPRP